MLGRFADFYYVLELQFKLAARLKGVRPNLKVLFMSGYADEAIAHHGVLSSYNGFVSKPISAIKLLRKVRSALDSDAPCRPGKL